MTLQIPSVKMFLAFHVSDCVRQGHPTGSAHYFVLKKAICIGLRCTALGKVKLEVLLTRFTGLCCKVDPMVYGLIQINAGVVICFDEVLMIQDARRKVKMIGPFPFLQEM